MIPVTEQSEPNDFSKKVRNPGQLFLTLKPNPSNKDWKNREYWRKALPDLYSAYQGVCAYCSEWIPYNTGVSTVDHFEPKGIAPNLAYEWKNFRLSSLRLNSKKGDYQDVLDPFALQQDTFILDFPSLIVKPNPILSDEQKNRAIGTIHRLGLNDETSIKSRFRWIRCYCSNEFRFIYLQRNAPFIAYELKRQNLKTAIKNIMKMR